jgi:hypothetical protein
MDRDEMVTINNEQKVVKNMKINTHNVARLSDGHYYSAVVAG